MKFKWKDDKHKIFEDINWIVARKNLSDYPDLNKRFEIHTNDSDFQLKGLFSQEGKPINFYGKILI